ncbi:MAG: nucleoside 2-deoxyribosyltransferase [Erysipelotrichaceae bacterium]|nr:nucleoside 2-deoxyribosyltransferase [Erysipelotrichaceae bacterium]MDY5252575.1 nucleoside 2-deoxyribosyltransferase [Erysipelotrichaceae bacterium]
MKVYVAGSLFNEAEAAQRKKEGQILRESFPHANIINPIDQPFNKDKSKLPTPLDIFISDEKEIIDSDILIADITNNDSGVMLAIGMAIKSEKKLIIGINSDIRLKSANKYDIPTYGMNHFVLGAILKYGHLVYSFDEAIELIKMNLGKDE